MNHESQCDRILRCLRKGNALTKLDCLKKFGSWHAGARIQNLRDSGVKIKTTMIKTRTGKRVARYSLA